MSPPLRKACAKIRRSKLIHTDAERETVEWVVEILHRRPKTYGTALSLTIGDSDRLLAVLLKGIAASEKAKKGKL